MKSVFGEVMTREVRTASGKIVDAYFGYRSIAARIVTSPEAIGTTNVLLDVIGKNAFAVYIS
jgi:hypothetical protein